MIFMTEKPIQQKIQEIKNKYKTCTNNKKHIDMLTEIVTLRSGKIKDGEIYINGRTKMTFIDKLGNEFKMLPSDIKMGHWSSYESILTNDPTYHMKELHKIIQTKGGKIKEGEIYINSRTKMTFIDKLGNEFKMSPNNIKNGKWPKKYSL